MMKFVFNEYKVVSCKEKNLHVQKQEQSAKCPESLNKINLKQNTTNVYVP